MTDEELKKFAQHNGVTDILHHLLIHGTSHIDTLVNAVESMTPNEKQALLNTYKEGYANIEYRQLVMEELGEFILRKQTNSPWEIARDGCKFRILSNSLSSSRGRTFELSFRAVVTTEKSDIEFITYSSTYVKVMEPPSMDELYTLLKQDIASYTWVKEMKLLGINNIDNAFKQYSSEEFKRAIDAISEFCLDIYSFSGLHVGITQWLTEVKSITEETCRKLFALSPRYIIAKCDITDYILIGSKANPDLLLVPVDGGYVVANKKDSAYAKYKLMTQLQN